tara:strand:- start:133 stop:663 length:531 start_codon:yes stop_codon:yes gene_type:complete
LKKGYFVVFVFVLILLDQLLKVWVFSNKEDILFNSGWWWDSVPFFNITYLENPGMAFGLLKGSGSFVKFFLTFFRLFAVFFMFFYVFYKYSSFSNFTVFVFGLLVAGAGGNCIDSVFYEYFGLNVVSVGGGLFSGNVIDMFHFSFFPPVFNLADSYITIGCVLGLIFYRKLSSVSV